MRTVEAIPSRQEIPRLSKDEVVQYYDFGYLGPYTLCSPAEAEGLRQRIDAEVLSGPGPSGARPGSYRHLDRRVVYDICAHPAIVGRVSSLLGSDLIAWHSSFWDKEPLKGTEVTWHQDIVFWPLEPQVSITAWVALTEATRENGCVQVVPGTHHATVAHIPSDAETTGNPVVVDPATIDQSKVVNMELKPGEFFLFGERMLHHSDPNRSQKRRLGFSVRLTVPFVRVRRNAEGTVWQEYDKGRPPGAQTSTTAKGRYGLGVVLVSGQDRIGINELVPPPTS